ncbi:hypothetical protein [Paracidobacterium acidisoli]|uniref:Lipoprotein n=1 Tax=Paracidobacterium acidisoli TaxID=2303751 RepID=A0A372IJ50_9BACT|nr:hypothetical protein [Paracidobacterium acidisoli]MBT9333137.1 hypothetical protein [Paracidobacterium acidisoli]
MQTRRTGYWKQTCAVVLFCAGVAGCGGGGTQQNTSIPTSSQAHTYVGTQASSGGLGGVYGLTTDHSTNYFNLNDVSYPGGSYVNFIGNITTPKTFEYFNTTVSDDPQYTKQVLYALEVPGDTAVLEFAPPITEQLPPAVFAESNGCQPLMSSPTTYQFVQIGGNGYGRVTVSTSQNNWSFSGFDILQTDGTDEKPAALGNGSCAQAAEGYVTTIPTTTNGTPGVDTVAISPNGYFIMNSAGAPSLAGVVQPGSAIDTSALTGASYAGFEYDASAISPQDTNVPGQLTQPMYFSATNAADGQMVGGVFPSGDPSQTPGTSFTIHLGTQDPSHNGIYPSVTATIPDPRQVCVSTPYAGTDASGNPTCTFPGVAVAGNPGGKYVLFVEVANPVTPDGTAIIDFLLYQQ